jgi:hypothetical protein
LEAFNTIEPNDWQAMRLMIQRLSYMIAQVHSQKSLRESNFDVVIGKNQHSPEAEKARWEAMSIRQSIRAANG